MYIIYVPFLRLFKFLVNSFQSLNIYIYIYIGILKYKEEMLQNHGNK